MDEPRLSGDRSDIDRDREVTKDQMNEILRRPAALCMKILIAAAALLVILWILGERAGAAAPAAENSEASPQTAGNKKEDVNASVIEKAVSGAEDVVREQVAGIGAAVVEDSSDPFIDRPDIDPDDWMYILANPWNDIGDYTPELASLEGQQFDIRIVEPMREFAEAARAEGLSVVLSSGYRSFETQTYLFNRKVAQYGEEVAQTIVARPGTSEHQTGLCCDITDRYYEMKDSSLENTALYQWMFEHCGEYGFIVRFPKGKEDITGIIYEPWHFRYVGPEAAKYIMEHELTLEEFLELYQK